VSLSWVASDREPVQSRLVGPVTVRDDGARQVDIRREYDASRKIMLSHEGYPRVASGSLIEYEVSVYLVNHFFNDL
jgi:hypothetical protein